MHNVCDKLYCIHERKYCRYEKHTAYKKITVNYRNKIYIKEITTYIGKKSSAYKYVTSHDIRQLRCSIKTYIILM